LPTAPWKGRFFLTPNHEETMTDHTPLGTETPDRLIAANPDELNRLLHDMRAENDLRLAELERKAVTDPIREEKIERMDRAIDHCLSRIGAVEAKAQRPALAIGEGSKGLSPLALEHKGAFEAYLRSGEAQALQRLEMKSQHAITAPDGGYLLPPHVEEGVNARIAGFSPIRAIAQVVTIAGTGLKKAIAPIGAEAGWSADTMPSNVPGANAFQNIDFPTGELYAQPAATQTMLDDAAMDIEGWIGDEIERAFAASESAAFINGNGANKPKGLLTYPTIDQANWSWGNLGFVSTGAAGAFPAANPSDVLVELVHSLKSVYRANAAFVMNRKTQSAIRSFKDANGQYLWQAPSIAGARATLMNFPIYEAEDMPNIATNSLSIAFGDFERGYVVVDRLGIRTLRDPFSAKPYVLFYTTKRVGGGIQDFDAIKLLKFAA
jgi:HK97 family phage major capsid protein